MAATAAPIAFGFVKIEDSTSPEPSNTSVEPAPTRTEAPAPIDPIDPESFLKRCSGNNKKTKQRCSGVIGKKMQQNTRPIYLPTCTAHRDQQSFAGWCKFQHADGKKCGRLFRWVPPYLELCSEHEGHSDLPCYFLKLPLELRHEIFRYLLPTKPIGSSTAALHDGLDDDGFALHDSHGRPWVDSITTRRLNVSQPPPSLFATSNLSDSVFPMPLLDVLLVNRQIYHEARDLLFSIAVFTIDVRKDGTFMCGRRLLEPRRADGSAHFLPDEADEAKERFLKTFDWAAVKNYSVDILLENWAGPQPAMESPTWDEEVEIYDIRDYVSVVVSGILAKSRNLCKLQVRLCLADFKWTEDQILLNTKLIVSPFERLRNVRQPHLAGVYFGRPYHNSTLSAQRPQRHVTKGLLSQQQQPPVFSVPSLPTHQCVLRPGMPVFDDYTAGWARCMTSSSSAQVTKKPPIRQMFTEFKDFYSKLSNIQPDITYRNGRHAFLHRARVAREQEDVECFRHLRNELIQYWYAYLEQEERKKTDMNARLSRMLDADIYPSHEWEEPDLSPQAAAAAAAARRRNSSTASSPVLLNADMMAKEGIPMTGNFNHLPSAGSRARCTIDQRRQAQAQAVVQRAHGQYQYAQMQQQHSQAQPQDVKQETRTMPGSQLSTPYLYNSSITSPATWPSSSSSASNGIFPSAAGEPGPSSKRRRVDSGFEEVDYPAVEECEDEVGYALPGMEPVVEEGEASYTGKGKGKMGASAGVGAGVGVVCGDVA